MSNMSYCRFQNTVPDLRDCYDALCEGNWQDLSYEEMRACAALVRLCNEIASDFGDEMGLIQAEVARINEERRAQS